jgi:uncharacterized protein YjbI with pentapeptide repeats
MLQKIIFLQESLLVEEESITFFDKITMLFSQFSTWYDFIIIILSILASVYSCVKCMRKYEQYKALKWCLDKETKKSLKKYVKTKFSTVIDDDISEDSKCNYNEDIIRYFIRNVFTGTISNKHYIILADSGMGKTTFLLQLFRRYYRKIFKHYKIAFFPLMYKSVLDNIESLDSKENTILLLDGFDEDEKAIENYEIRLKEILDASMQFYRVIITCRTQFFPNEKSEPYDTGQLKFGVGDKRSVFKKFYINVFNSKDIKSYLKKKYHYPIQIRKLKRAEHIVNSCPKLAIRPMLLSYINDLCENESNYKYIYEIYYALVDKWIRRETANTQAVELNDNEKESYDTLYQFTVAVAMYMYNLKSLYIDSDKLNELCRKGHINIPIIKAKSRSLLNRDGAGRYKFAHKSIFEFILAKQAYEDEAFRMTYDFSAYDMAFLFLKEMCQNAVEQIAKGTKLTLPIKKLGLKRLNLQWLNEEWNRTFTKQQLLTIVKIDLSNVNLEGAYLKNAFFTGTNLKGANLNRINGDQACFSKSYIENANFIQASLNNTIFNGAILSGSIFRNAKLRNAQFQQADLSYADFNGADLDGANLHGAILKGVSYSQLIESKANLRSANILGVTYTKKDLEQFHINPGALDKMILIDYGGNNEIVSI